MIQRDQMLSITSAFLRLIIAVIFRLAGSGKFQTASTMAINFEKWNLGRLIKYSVGIIELLGAIFLFFPKTVLLGCFMLIVIIIAAVVVHFVHFEDLGLPFLNLMLILALLFVAKLKKEKSIQKNYNPI